MRLPVSVALTFTLVASAFALEWQTTHLDLTTAPLQQTTEATFEFTNPSARAVTITGVDSSCDCLEATPSAKVIAPGASGRIHAKFTLADRYGRLKRTILVSTDEGNPPVQLTVQLDIPEAATLSPRSVEWKLGGAVTTQVVELTIATGVELAVHSVQTASDAFATRLEAVEPGRRYHLHVTPKSTAAVANAAFRLHARTPAGRDLVFSAYGNVR